MHRLKGESIKPPYKMQEVQNYIRFGRSIKPQFTQEAAALLKNEYKQMRQKQKFSQKNAYKLTVRQLESMIRLSEALARVHLDTEIRKVYVEEVCRLMRVSNIERVHADIQLGVTSQIAIDTNKEDRIRQLVSFSY